jgi:endonuclease/exonuclease/phosphatase family metal-dependent hydrolase
MPKLRQSDIRAAQHAWSLFVKLPTPAKAVLVGFAAVVGVVFLASQRRLAAPEGFPAAEAAAPGEVAFTFWNVENLFDDKVDPGRRAVDRDFDEGFAEDAALRQQKLDQIATAVLRLNGGVGPDVFAFAEVESVRAADLLRGTLNAKLQAVGKGDKAYTQLAMKNIGNDAGRHIGTGVLSRLPINHTRTRMLGRNLRILEVHLVAGGADLTVIASHWTSQIGREGGNGSDGRDRYARTIYENYKAAADRDPKVDYLVCGDFNCPPDDPSLTDVLGAFGDRARLAGPPAFLNLMAGKDPSRYGTLWYSGRPLIYDQMCVSPGLLDAAGWGCDPESVRAESQGLLRVGSTRREPWRFGDPKNPPTGGRGYSDHLPVSVRLRVGGAANPE